MWDGCLEHTAYGHRAPFFNFSFCIAFSSPSSSLVRTRAFRALGRGSNPLGDANTVTQQTLLGDSVVLSLWGFEGSRRAILSRRDVEERRHPSRRRMADRSRRFSYEAMSRVIKCF